MYAVVDDRGRQYKVAAGDEILVERLENAPGETAAFGRVLLLSSAEGGTVVGAPVVEGARVQVRVLGETKGPKTLSFKLRRRKNSRTLKGHRQRYTRLKVLEIVAPSA